MGDNDIEKLIDESRCLEEHIVLMECLLKLEEFDDNFHKICDKYLNGSYHAKELNYILCRICHVKGMLDAHIFIEEQEIERRAKELK